MQTTKTVTGLITDPVDIDGLITDPISVDAQREATFMDTGIKMYDTFANPFNLNAFPNKGYTDIILAHQIETEDFEDPNLYFDWET